MPHRVAIVILTKENLDVFKRCIDSIYRNFTKDFCLYIADTGSSDETFGEMKTFLKSYNDSSMKLLRYNHYNFAKVNNDVVFNHFQADHKWILFCNNDVEFHCDFSGELFMHDYHIPHIGTYGAKLCYPDKTIQHAGQFVIMKTIYNTISAQLGHLNMGKPGDSLTGYAKVQGNTFACCATRLDLFGGLNGLNEKYEECFEDVEYNLRCLLAGKVNICNLNANITHYESLTRRQNKESGKLLMRDYHNNMLPFLEDNYDELRELFLEFKR